MSKGENSNRIGSKSRRRGQPSQSQNNNNRHQQWQQPNWHTPPSPYPTTNNYNSGPKSHQLNGWNYPVWHQQQASADQANAMNVSLTGKDSNWYMDTGASSHLTNDPGKISTPLFVSPV